MEMMQEEGELCSRLFPNNPTNSQAMNGKKFATYQESLKGLAVVDVLVRS